MYSSNSQANLFIQVCMLVIIIGLSYHTIIGMKVRGRMASIIRLLGIGILFIAVASIERALVNFGIVKSDLLISAIQDTVIVLGLIFLGFGFSKLVSEKKD